MDKKTIINIEKIEEKTEKDIIELLNNKGKCLYGEIIKELKLSVFQGQSTIYSLISRGIISHKNRSAYLQLNVTLK